MSRKKEAGDPLVRLAEIAADPEAFKLTATYARLMARVNKNGPTVRPELGPCWLWTGAFGQGAYGVFCFNGRKPTTIRKKTHRFSHELHIGPIPEGLDVMHKCDVPACVNPAHLVAGTRGENNRDRSDKGRGAVGERHGRARLTAIQALTLRADRAAGMTQVRLATKYNVSRRNVRAIIARETWACLPEQT